MGELVNTSRLIATLRKRGVPPHWLRDEIAAGRIPHLRAGRACLFDVDAVEQHLLERARRGEARSTEGGTS